MVLFFQLFWSEIDNCEVFQGSIVMIWCMYTLWRDFHFWLLMHPSPHVHLCVCLWWELSVNVVNLVTMVYAELSDFTHTWKSVLFYHHLYFPHPPNLETVFLRVWLFAFFFFEIPYTVHAVFVWLIPLGMPSRSVYVVADGRISSFLMAE